MSKPAVNREWYKRKRAEGLCVHCGKRPALESTCFCQECRNAAISSQNKRRAERRAAGLCTKCSQPTENWLCDSCQAKRRIQTRKRYWENRLQGETSPQTIIYQKRRAKGLCGTCGQAPAARHHCEECHKKWLAKHNKPEWVAHLKRMQKEARFVRKYGMTLADYESMLVAQGGKCIGCGRTPEPKKPLRIDHSHETGEVRGLLCHGCNAALGLVGENPDTLIRLSRYISSPKIYKPMPREQMEATSGRIQ